ncbi:MAG: hypothetical protein CSA42_07855, partial [Gammaproteobacteria bacterium]
MQVHRSGYYNWLTRGQSRTCRENKKMISVIQAVHAASKGFYGARRHAEELTSQGFPCGRSRARTIMNLAGVEAKQKKKYKATTDSNHNREIVGWSMNERVNRHLVIRATRMAIWKKKPAKGLIFHSDRGSQYRSNDFKSYIAG